MVGGWWRFTAFMKTADSNKYEQTSSISKRIPKDSIETYIIKYSKYTKRLPQLKVAYKF